MQPRQGFIVRSYTSIHSNSCFWAAPSANPLFSHADVAFMDANTWHPAEHTAHQSVLGDVRLIEHWKPKRTYLVHYSVATAQEGVLQAFHILNQFDIPKGAARGMDNGKEIADYTLWTSVSDLKNLRYYFRTFDNSRIRMIDLKKMDLDAQEIKTISMAGQEVIEDLSSKAN